MLPEQKKILDWLTRDHQSQEYWKNLGRDIFLSANGDSDLARQRLADVLWRSVSGVSTDPVTVEVWNDDFSKIVTKEVEPPGVSTSNDAYIDWAWIADYVLLASASSWDRLDEENQRRQEAYDRELARYQSRQIVHQVINNLSKCCESSDDENERILRDEIKGFKKIHLVTAKRIRAGGIERYAESRPTKPVSLAPYKTVYF